jgi:NADH dehydrogenase FAD-containing subunit
MSRRLLVVGSGTAGLMVANLTARALHAQLRRHEVEITVLGEREDYICQPGFLYVAFALTARRT